MRDREDQLAKVYESYETVGTVLPAIADELGIPHTVKVAAGAGDNAAAAVGTGTVGDGSCNIVDVLILLRNMLFGKGGTFSDVMDLLRFITG